MKIAICDDQMLLHAELKKCLENYALKRNLIIVYYDYTTGSDLIASDIDYDIIFMDYQMEGINGIETSRRIRSKNINTKIIFLTSFKNIVFDTFEVNAYRFLLKPIDMKRLTSAMDDYLSSIDDSNFILLKTEESKKLININDIIYIEAADKYCYVRTIEENILYRNTLADIEKQLPEEKFFRSHRTYLVGLQHIISHTSTDILFDNKERALISKLKLTPFKKAFSEYLKRYKFAKR